MGILTPFVISRIRKNAAANAISGHFSGIPIGKRSCL